MRQVKEDRPGWSPGWFARLVLERRDDQTDSCVGREPRVERGIRFVRGGEFWLIRNDSPHPACGETTTRAAGTRLAGQRALCGVRFAVPSSTRVA